MCSVWDCLWAKVSIANSQEAIFSCCFCWNLEIRFPQAHAILLMMIEMCKVLLLIVSLCVCTREWGGKSIYHMRIYHTRSSRTWILYKMWVCMSARWVLIFTSHDTFCSFNEFSSHELEHQNSVQKRIEWVLTFSCISCTIFCMPSHFSTPKIAMCPFWLWQFFLPCLFFCYC